MRYFLRFAKNGMVKKWFKNEWNETNIIESLFQSPFQQTSNARCNQNPSIDPHTSYTQQKFTFGLFSSNL